MSDTDKAGRYLIKRDANGFLRWLLKQPSIDFHAWIDARRVALPDQRDLTHDLIAACRVGDEMEALCIELESESSSDTASRLLCGYVPRLVIEPGGLRLSGVGGYIINLTGATQTGSVSQTLTIAPVCQFGGTVGQCNLRKESASAVIADISTGFASVWLLAWLPLMDGGAESATIEGWKQNVLRLPVERDRGILAELTKTFATSAGNHPSWKKALGGWKVSKNAYLEEIREEVRAEARAEGLAEGEVIGEARGKVVGQLEHARNTILRQGRLKFPKAATKKQKSELDAIDDLSRLERMLDQILTASSWTELLSTM